MYNWFLISSTGAIGTHSQTQSPLVEVNRTQEIDPNLVPSGFTTFGPYDKNNPMPSSYQAAWSNPQAYLYQNGAFVDNPNWPTIQLAQAKATQKAAVEAGLNATLAGGFKSTTKGHTYVTTTNGQTNMEGDLKRFELDSTLTSLMFFTMDAGWISHTQSELQSAFLDGGKWKDAQYSQAQTLTTDISNATTVADVQAIVWQEATY